MKAILKIFTLVVLTISSISLFSMEQKKGRFFLLSSKKSKKDREDLYIIRNSSSKKSGKETSAGIENPESPFKNFHNDMLYCILVVLQKGKFNHNLPDTTHIINSFAQTNRYFNESMNQPGYCLQGIKYLSEGFNCSDWRVCSLLQTKQAKQQLRIQKQLIGLCHEAHPNEWLFALLCSQGVSMYFTSFYQNKILLPLMVAMNNNSDVVAFLLSVGVDVNYSTKEGLSPLMFAVETNNILMAQILLGDGRIRVNQKDANGNTALHILLNTHSPNIRMLELLLKHDADPDLLNQKGIKPFDLVDHINNPHIKTEVEKIIKKI